MFGGMSKPQRNNYSLLILALSITLLAAGLVPSPFGKGGPSFGIFMPVFILMSNFFISKYVHSIKKKLLFVVYYILISGLVSLVSLIVNYYLVEVFVGDKTWFLWDFQWKFPLNLQLVIGANLLYWFIIKRVASIFE
ncbi:MAG: hypothetical protein ACJAZ2_001372 [Glaciecola sp.]|jgi:hypothetical protein